MRQAVHIIRVTFVRAGISVGWCLQRLLRWQLHGIVVCPGNKCSGNRDADDEPDEPGERRFSEF